MNNELSRVCSKCQNQLNEKEAYCPNCGTLSVTKNKGTIIIKPNKIKIVITSSFLITILLFVLGVVISFYYNKIISIPFSLSLASLVFGLALTKVNKQSKELAEEKSRELLFSTLNNNNLSKCKYCSTVIKNGDNYCYFCGSKIK